MEHKSLFIMERLQKGRSASDYESRPRRSTSSETAFTSSSATHVYSAEYFQVSSVSAARRRHVHQVSLPHNQLALDGHYSRPLSPYEERLLGRATHSVGIPLAEPSFPSPTVTGKIISSVKRAVSLKREKTPVRTDYSYAVNEFTDGRTRVNSPRKIPNNMLRTFPHVQPRHRQIPHLESMQNASGRYQTSQLSPRIARPLVDTPRLETSS